MERTQALYRKHVLGYGNHEIGFAGPTEEGENFVEQHQTTTGHHSHNSKYKPRYTPFLASALAFVAGYYLGTQEISDLRNALNYFQTDFKKDHTLTDTVNELVPLIAINKNSGSKELNSKIQ